MLLLGALRNALTLNDVAAEVLTIVTGSLLLLSVLGPERHRPRCASAHAARRPPVEADAAPPTESDINQQERSHVHPVSRLGRLIAAALALVAVLALAACGSTKEQRVQRRRRARPRPRRRRPATPAVKSRRA